MSKSKALLAQGVQVAGLVAEAGAGVAEVVAAVHQRVTAAPEARHEAALRPYRWVRWGLLLLAQWGRRWPQVAPAGSRWRALHAALNGIVGDHLQGSEHPWAQSMLWCDRQGREWPLAELQSQRILLFVHGLCMSDRAWQQPLLQSWIAQREAEGYRVAFLRYNSGRAIADNGRQLAAQLHQLAPRRLVLIGHSMGGLLMRAAYTQATASTWLPALRLAVYLGSPHRGAPLERLGERSNRLFALTPWSAPLMRLGAVRSQGIQDLRHGSIGSDERDLPGRAHHLLVAAQIRVAGRAWLPNWLGDGLVPVRSALAQDLGGTEALRAPHLQRRLLPGLHHMELLHHPQMLACLDAAWQTAQA